MLTYWFYPNPGNADYLSNKVLLIAAICLVLIVSSFAVSAWRKGLVNSVTRKLSKNWASRMRWFAFVGLFLVICRVEEIQFMAMRALIGVWGIALALYALFQVWWFRKKHYTVVQKKRVHDPRDAYLPGKKK